MSRPRLLVVDDHRLFVEALVKMLEPEFEVVGTLANGHELIASAEALRPDVILLDVSMPLLNGFDAARQLRQRGVAAKLLFLTMHEDADYVREAFHCGASGYVLKRATVAELLTAVRRVLANDVYVTPLIKLESLVANLAIAASVASPDRTELTPRQRQVLQLVAEGHGGKSIASLLNISLKTVEYHKASLMKQLGLRSTAELTRYAIKHRIVAPE
jgi:DNA-binding NarL/FixJ family response regulator